MVNERLVNLFGKGRTTTEKVSTLLEPKVTSFFRAIQGHSGSNLVDPALQENVLLPEDFSEYIYHVGNVSEIHSIIRSGLIPGGRSLTRDRQSVFFTAVNPMDDDRSIAENRCDLDKPRIAPYRNTWSPHQKTVY